MNIQCTYCQAFHWISERVADSTLSHPEFTTCCLKGLVQLDPIKPLPPLLFCLYYFSNEERHFKAFIRGYNSALAFTTAEMKKEVEFKAFKFMGSSYTRTTKSIIRLETTVCATLFLYTLFLLPPVDCVPSTAVG